ncbi:MAG: type II secretion system protein [Rhodocyclaceae bacterium]|nr:type II secretion system protein [Rhodocyclaceae bacterium]
MSRPTPARGQRGFTYVALLLGVALMASTLAWAGQSWQLARQREMERELLFAGRAIRHAIAAYNRGGPVRGELPTDLSDLLADGRGVRLQRHLRRLYADPTGAGWVEIRDERGGIVGVHSASTAAPLKRAGFERKELAFEGAPRYADWRFSIEPVVLGQGDAAGQRKGDIRNQYRPGAHIGTGDGGVSSPLGGPAGDGE